MDDLLEEVLVSVANEMVGAILLSVVDFEDIVIF